MPAGPSRPIQPLCRPAIPGKIRPIRAQALPRPFSALPGSIARAKASLRLVRGITQRRPENRSPIGCYGMPAWTMGAPKAWSSAARQPSGSATVSVAAATTRASRRSWSDFFRPARVPLPLIVFVAVRPPGAGLRPVLQGSRRFLEGGEQGGEEVVLDPYGFSLPSLSSLP